MSRISEILREVGGQVDATGHLLKGVALQPVAGLAGLSRTTADLLRGKGKDEALKGGAETVEAVEGWGGGPFTRRGQERLEGLGGTIRKAGDWATENVPGAAQGAEGWDRYSQANPAAAAILGAVVEAPSKGAGKAARAGKRAAKAADAPEVDVPEPRLAVDAPAAPVVDAPAKVNVAKRFQGGENKGIYRGTEAFGGITPQKLGSMRSDYLRSMEEGAPFRDWYDRASETNWRLTGQDPAKANKLADIEAITSARTPVGANMMYSARGWNQDLVGDPVRTGGFPVDMGNRIMQTWDEGSGGEGLGLKRSPYRAGLSVHWQGPESVKRATHDIHDVRAWGIKDPKTGEAWSKGVAPAGHRFLDEQAQYAMDEANKRKLAGKEGWNLHNAQAAAWIAQKAKAKGMNVADAGKDYTDFVPDYSAQITREWTPGATSGHLPELLRSDDAMRSAYAQQMEQAVRGPSDIDKLAAEMGMLTDTTLENRGVYEGQTNPGFASQVLVGKEPGGPGMDPASRRGAESVAAAHGLVGLQDQVALNYLGGEAPLKSAGAFQVNTGSPMSPEALADLARTAEKHGGDIPQVDPRGARILSFQGEGDPGRKALIQALRQEYPQAGVTPQHRDSSLFPLKEGSDWEKPEQWSSKPYIAKIEAGGPKMVAGFDRAMQGMAPQMLQTTEALAAKHGMTQAPYYRPMMEALSTGGLAALKDLVAKGIVPVAAFAVIAEGLGGEEGMQ